MLGKVGLGHLFSQNVDSSPLYVHVLFGDLHVFIFSAQMLVPCLNSLSHQLLRGTGGQNQKTLTKAFLRHQILYMLASPVIIAST